MQAKHIELLHQPWLIELGAFYLNCNEPDGIKLKGICGRFSCDLNMVDAELILILPDCIRLEFDLNCAICLVSSYLHAKLSQQYPVFQFRKMSLICNTVHELSTNIYVT